MHHSSIHPCVSHEPAPRWASESCFELRLSRNESNRAGVWAKRGKSAAPPAEPSRSNSIVSYAHTSCSPLRAPSAALPASARSPLQDQSHKKTSFNMWRWEEHRKKKKKRSRWHDILVVFPPPHFWISSTQNVLGAHGTGTHTCDVYIYILKKKNHHHRNVPGSAVPNHLENTPRRSEESIGEIEERPPSQPNTVCNKYGNPASNFMQIATLRWKKLQAEMFIYLKNKIK